MTQASNISLLDKEISVIVKRLASDRTLATSKKDITYSEFLLNKMLMIAVIKEGVPYSLFELIRNFTPFTEEDWAYLLDISTKSLQRYKQSARNFKSIQSEKIIELSEVIKTGIDVFGEMDKFNLWLQTPNFSLGKHKPVELLKDSYGKEMVLGELIRINHGILV